LGKSQGWDTLFGWGGGRGLQCDPGNTNLKVYEVKEDKQGPRKEKKESAREVDWSKERITV